MPKPAPYKRLTERCAKPFAGARVDRAAGTIANVVICGFESANGRDYPAPVFARDYAKYEGRPVNADHSQAATVDRRLGWFSAVKVGEDGKPRGTLNLLKSHPLYERVMESAERNPALFGFSHVAYCKTRTERGREVVESIERVESIDLVADPATTHGFFEGKGVKISLKTFGERFGPKWGAKKWGAFEKLCEDLGDMADAPVMDPPADDAADGGDLKGALMAALSPMLDEAFESGDASKAVAALKDFIKLHAKHTGGKAAPSEDDSEEEEETPGKESKRPGLAGVLKECTAAGFTPDTTQLVTLSEIPSKGGRAVVIETLKKATEGKGRETPTSTTGRAGTQTTRPAQKATEAVIPTDPKDFAKRYRE